MLKRNYNTNKQNSILSIFTLLHVIVPTFDMFYLYKCKQPVFDIEQKIQTDSSDIKRTGSMNWKHNSSNVIIWYARSDFYQHKTLNIAKYEQGLNQRISFDDTHIQCISLIWDCLLKNWSSRHVYCCEIYYTYSFKCLNFLKGGGDKQ